MGLPLPALDVNAGLAPFAAVAVPMVVVTVLVLGLVRPADGRSPLLTQLLLAISVIGGGSVLLLALLFVFLDPNGTTAWTWVLLAFNFMMMVPLGLWFVGQIVFRDRRAPPGDWRWPVGLGLAVTGSEVLMGLVFVVGGAGGGVGPLPALALGLSSVWFFWSMAAVMAPLVLWAPLSPTARTGGWALVLAAVVGPWVRPFPLLGGAAMAALMGAALGALLRPLWRGAVAAPDARLLLGLAAAFFAMSTSGLAVAVSSGADGEVLAFGATMAVVMIAEVSYLIHRGHAPRALGASGAAVPASEVAVDAASRAGPTAGP